MAGGGRTKRMLRKMEEEREASAPDKPKAKSSVFVWPSGGAHGEKTGKAWSGEGVGARKPKSSDYDKKKDL